MVTIKSTTYCDDPECPGHSTSREYPGKSLVMTDDMAAPLALVDNEDA